MVWFGTGDVGVPLGERRRAGDVARVVGGDERRLARGVQRGRHHPGGGGVLAGRARLEVRWHVELEVAVDHGHLDGGAERRLLARKPSLEGAGRRTAVPRQVVAVVALLAGQQDAVAALAGARARSRASRLYLAGRRATVERYRVAVVAALGPFLLAVPARRLVALRDRVARAGPAGVPAAIRRAGALLDGDAGIARLVAGQDAVAAVGDAGRLDQRAGVALLDRAGRRAAVTAVDVAVVALLVSLEDAIAADRHRA